MNDPVPELEKNNYTFQDAAGEIVEDEDQELEITLNEQDDDCAGPDEEQKEQPAGEEEVHQEEEKLQQQQPHHDPSGILDHRALDDHDGNTQEQEQPQVEAPAPALNELQKERDLRAQEKREHQTAMEQLQTELAALRKANEAKDVQLSSSTAAAATAAVVTTVAATADSSSSSSPPKKKRGRPKGYKVKKKLQAEDGVVQDGIALLLAESKAYLDGYTNNNHLLQNATPLPVTSMHTGIDSLLVSKRKFLVKAKKDGNARKRKATSLSVETGAGGADRDSTVTLRTPTLTASGKRLGRPPGSKDKSQRLRRLKSGDLKAAPLPDKRPKGRPKKNWALEPSIYVLAQERNQATAKTWLKHYAMLQAFKAEFGHCNVPVGTHHINPETNVVDDDKNKFRRWIMMMRTDHRFLREGKPTSLTSEKIQLLTKIGFNWQLLERKYTWQEQFERLVKWKEEYNTVNVPQKSTKKKCYEGLGDWVLKQRRGYRLGKLEEEKIAELDTIGFKWTLRAKGGTLEKRMRSKVDELDELTTMVNHHQQQQQQGGVMVDMNTLQQDHANNTAIQQHHQQQIQQLQQLPYHTQYHHELTNVNETDNIAAGMIHQLGNIEQQQQQQYALPQYQQQQQQMQYQYQVPAEVPPQPLQQVVQPPPPPNPAGAAYVAATGDGTPEGTAIGVAGGSLGGGLGNVVDDGTTPNGQNNTRTMYDFEHLKVMFT